MGRKLVVITLGALVAAAVVSSRRRSLRSASASENGGQPGESDSLRRAVGEARERLGGGAAWPRSA